MNIPGVCIVIYLVNMTYNDYLDQHPAKPGLKNFVGAIRARDRGPRHPKHAIRTTQKTMG